MKNIFYKAFIIILFFELTACALFKPKPPKLRLVGLDGKYREVNTKTPNLNADALNAQGKGNNDIIVKNGGDMKKSLPVAPIVAEAQKVAPAKNGLAHPLVEVTPESEKLVASDSKPIEVLKTQETKESSNSILFATPSDSEEYDISDDKEEKAASKKEESVKIINKKHIKKPIFISKNKAKVHSAQAAPTSIVKAGGLKGYFVQVGSFAEQGHAQNKLDKMAEFHSGRVETVGGDKAMYRALLGPFPNKNAARNLLNNVKSAGYDAVLVKR